ncbi:succinylglutamate desuccinylase [Shewanella sp. OMA3-2]|uniref:succinylglutamate desuccinylase n=1 Tax=Shewanella sp. OMA3-2 TaxID=2908650 RepID=UPI001F2EF9CF|nr:succinylglutamate desuccinylase [Shewanella sp. OMA3-2]UJF20781.1 succinylglutamate desuccinylase [Shewanella sp. OMA3-2]
MTLPLMDTRDFLAFTLSSPVSLPQQYHFHLSTHTQVDILDTGVIVFTPLSQTATAKKDIVLSCAVHGNETAPIEICNQLIKSLLSETIITKHRLLFLIGNPLAILNKTRFIEENMNRLFSGAHSKGQGLVNAERIRAKALEGYVADFFNKGASGSQRIHYDLHTAIRPSKHEKFAIYPYRPGRAFSGEQMMFLAACGVDTILFHHEPTTTFSYYSSEQFQADAFTVELGKVMPFGENDMSRFEDTNKMLTALITQDVVKLPKYNSASLNLYKVSRSINKNADDFSFSFASDAPNFSQFNQGETLATEAGDEIKVQHAVEAIVFPNAKVPIGQRTVLCLVPAPNEDVQ